MNNIFEEQENLMIVEETELKESSWIKIFRKNNFIASTEELAAKYKKVIKADKNEVIFTTQAHKLITGILGSLLFTGFLLGALNKNTERTVQVFLFTFCFIFLIGILYEILNRTENFKITVNKEGLRIKDMLYKWPEIKKIYIIKRPVGKGYKLFINLSLDTLLNDKIEITNHKTGRFNGIERKLSAYIEFYRNQFP